MFLSQKKKQTSRVLKTFLFCLTACFPLFLASLEPLKASNSHEENGEDFYEKATQIFLETFDNTREKKKGKQEKGFFASNKITIYIPSDYELMRIILHNIYEDTFQVEELFERKFFLTDLKTLKDLHIIAGTDDDPGRTLINRLDTRGMQGSKGLGYLAKGAMFVDILKATNDHAYLGKKAKNHKAS